MNYEDIKRHFENSPPPREVKWTQWANITDTQVFLKSCYTTIRNYNGPADRCPAWRHLRDFYILMKKTSTQPAHPEENTSEEIAPGQTAPQTNADPVPDEEISQAETETAI